MDELRHRLHLILPEEHVVLEVPNVPASKGYEMTMEERLCLQRRFGDLPLGMGDLRMRHYDYGAPASGSPVTPGPVIRPDRFEGTGPTVNMTYGTVQHLEALQAKFRKEYQYERTVTKAYEAIGHICNMVYDTSGRSIQ